MAKHVYSQEELWLIQHYRTQFNWGSKKIFNKLGKDSNWSQSGVLKVINKFEQTGSTARRSGSGRPRTARTQENEDEVLLEILSQEDPETSEKQKHKSPREIARRLNISRSC